MSLRAHIEVLREYMFAAHSYSPDSFSHTMSIGGLPASMLGDADSQEAERRRFKDKLSQKRAKLRKLVLWAQQKESR